MLKQPPGTWVNAIQGKTTGVEGRGQNMIALPFLRPEGTPGPNDRMLVSQRHETPGFQTLDGRS